MNYFVRIKDGLESVTCNVTNYRKYIDMHFGDTPPEGFLPVVKSPDKPSPGNGEVLWFTYSVNGDHVDKTYFVKRLPRTFSKLKMYVVFAQAGLWARLMEWMSTVVTPDGISAKVAFDLANEITDAHPLFESFYEQAKAALFVTDEQADALLDQCVID